MVLGPEVFIFTLQAMLLQECHAFFLESPGPVMFGLVLDVIDSLGQMRNTHAKAP
jgi:hypothetical protein